MKYEGKSISHKYMRFSTFMSCRFEFATVSGNTFQHSYTSQVDCVCVIHLYIYLEWLEMATAAVMYNCASVCSALLFVGKTKFEF